MDFAAELLAENDAFTQLVRDADPATPIPTCPGWSVKQLLRHVGRGHYWAAQMVEDRLTDALDPRLVRKGKAPDTAEATAEWLSGGAQAVVDAVAQVGPETVVWTFLGPRPADWWVRRRLHEVAVHRADAALALGEDFSLATGVAADGLTEWLERVVIAGIGDRVPLSGGQTVHLHGEDGGEWTLSSDGTQLTMGHEHDAHASVTVSGSASALLLATTRRIAADDPRLSVEGDATVWRGWLDRTPF